MSTTDLTDLDDGFGHWLAGFVDGEGCFRLQTHRNVPRCVFQVSLRADDRDILDEMQRRTGLGHVHSNGQSAVNNGHPQARWAIQNHADCFQLVHIFDRYPLRAKKARDFAIWRAAVIEHARQRAYPYGKRNHSRMVALWDELRNGREFSAEQAPVVLPVPSQLQLH